MEIGVCGEGPMEHGGGRNRGGFGGGRGDLGGRGGGGGGLSVRVVNKRRGGFSGGED